MLVIFCVFSWRFSCCFQGMLSLWSCFRHVWQPVLLDRSATRKMSVLTSFTLRSRSVSWPSTLFVRCSHFSMSCQSTPHLWSLMFWGSSLMASDKAYNLRRFLACQQPRELKQLKQKHEDADEWLNDGECRWMHVIAIAIRIGLAAHLVYWNALGHFHPHCSPVKQTVGWGPTDAECFFMRELQASTSASQQHTTLIGFDHAGLTPRWGFIGFIGLIWLN